MLSLNALDDLEAFLISISDCCSIERSGAFSGVDGFLELFIGLELFARDFLVFFTWSGGGGGPMSENVAFADVLPRAGRGSGDFLVVSLTPLYKLALTDGFFKVEEMSVPADDVLWPVEASFEDKVGAGDILDLEGSCIADACCERKSFSLGCRVVDALEGDLEVITDGVRDGDRTGLLPLKKLDCLLGGPGDGGIRDNVSIVRSDNEGRGRPRRSASPTAASVPSIGASSEASPAFSDRPPLLSPPLEVSLFCRGFSGVL